MDGLLLLRVGRPLEVLECGQGRVVMPTGVLGCPHDGLSRR